MTRAELHPHHPHLPYREWGGGGAGDMARRTEDMLGRCWLDRQSVQAIARARAPMYRTDDNRAALAEWLGTGLPSRSQEFDPPRPLQYSPLVIIILAEEHDSPEVGQDGASEVPSDRSAGRVGRHVSRHSGWVIPVIRRQLTYLGVTS